jgi:GxxExxY protein
MSQMNADSLEQSDHGGDVLGTDRRRLGLGGVKKDAQTYEIIGAAMEVHRELGPGFLEGVYQDALQLELTSRTIPFVREHAVPVAYKGVLLATPYRADFLCYGSVLVELKAIKAVAGPEEAQVIHYLKATGITRALLVNFGAPQLEYERLVLELSRTGDSTTNAGRNCEL